MPHLKPGHSYDVSYSGLKTACIHRLEQFWNQDFEKTPENIAASFQEQAIKILARPIAKAVKDTGLKTLVAGGGVAANSLLRKRLGEIKDLQCIFPSLKYCTDNAAMIAGLGFHYLKAGRTSTSDVTASPRVTGFSKKGRQ